MASHSYTHNAHMADKHNEHVAYIFKLQTKHARAEWRGGQSGAKRNMRFDICISRRHSTNTLHVSQLFDLRAGHTVLPRTPSAVCALHTPIELLLENVRHAKLGCVNARESEKH